LVSTSQEGHVLRMCWEEENRITSEQGAGKSGEVTRWAISYGRTGLARHVARIDASRVYRVVNYVAVY
jgi:hypothetical protein